MAHERAHEGVVFLSSQLGVQMYRNKPKSCESKLVAEMWLGEDGNTSTALAVVAAYGLPIAQLLWHLSPVFGRVSHLSEPTY